MGEYDSDDILTINELIPMLEELKKKGFGDYMLNIGGRRIVSLDGEKYKIGTDRSIGCEYIEWEETL